MAYLYADTLQVLYFGAGLTVEEQLVPFKSRYPLKLNLLGKPPKYRIKIWLQIHNTMKYDHPNRIYITKSKCGLCHKKAPTLLKWCFRFGAELSFCSLLNICLMRLWPAVEWCDESRWRTFAQPCTHSTRCRRVMLNQPVCWTRCAGTSTHPGRVLCRSATALCWHECDRASPGHFFVLLECFPLCCNLPSLFALRAALLVLVHLQLRPSN